MGASDEEPSEAGSPPKRPTELLKGVPQCISPHFGQLSCDADGTVISSPFTGRRNRSRFSLIVVPHAWQASSGRTGLRRAAGTFWLCVFFMTTILVRMEGHDQAVVPEDQPDVDESPGDPRLGRWSSGCAEVCFPSSGRLGRGLTLEGQKQGLWVPGQDLKESAGRTLRLASPLLPALNGGGRYVEGRR